MLIRRYAYFPFGSIWKDEKATTAEGNTNNTPTATADESGTGYAYDGQFVDKEDGLERFGARWYDPDLGLWVSTDPVLDQEIGGTSDAGKANGGVSNPANLGLYIFAMNNPITGKDPTGNFTLTPRESGILQASTSVAGVVGSGLLFAGGAAACPFTAGAGCGAAAIGAAGLAYNADNLTAGLATIAANDQAPTLGGAAIASRAHTSSENGELAYAGVGLALGGGELAASARSGEAAAARIPFRGARGAPGEAAEAEGGVLVPRNNANAQVTEKGLNRIKEHLLTLDPDNLTDPPNAAMLSRLSKGERSVHDLNFYLHELKESAIMRRTGYSWENYPPAHRATLEWQGLPHGRPDEAANLYHPDVIRANSELFNRAAHPK